MHPYAQGSIILQWVVDKSFGAAGCLVGISKSADNMLRGSVRRLSHMGCPGTALMLLGAQAVLIRRLCLFMAFSADSLCKISTSSIAGVTAELLAGFRARLQSTEHIAACRRQEASQACFTCAMDVHTAKLPM